MKLADYPEIAAQWHPTKNGDIVPSEVSSHKKCWWLCCKGHEWEVRFGNRIKGNGCPYCGRRRCCPENCLAILYPNIAAEWHPTKNGKITPSDIATGSKRECWWLCKKGHEWEARCANRAYNGTSCPCCSGRKVCHENCLATLYPEIAFEWHPSKNGDVTPVDVVAGNANKYWWLCKKGHEWETTCDSRVSGRGCPYCASKKLCCDNCLAGLYPQVAAEWHPTKNGSVTPNDVYAKSANKYWWLCKNGHEWLAMIANRTLGCDCPYCAGRKVCSDNCLAILYPQIADEWHPTKNGSMTPRDVVPGTKNKYWWLCKSGHEWQISCDNRVRSRHGCPYCTGQKVCFDNCLATMYPKIAAEWHPSKNGNITPSDIVAGTPKEYWWLCKKGHEWQRSGDARVRRGRGCPYCANCKVCHDNCLATLYPQIAAEWHPVKNGNITPKDVIAGSNKKYWWLCKKGHKWLANCNSRVGRNSGCPVCNESKGEKRITNYFQLNKIAFKRQVKFNSCRRKMPLPFDFMVKHNSSGILIEYQGDQHYRPFTFRSSQERAVEILAEIKARDRIKADWCRSRNIKLLIIPYWNYNHIEEILNELFVEKST